MKHIFKGIKLLLFSGLALFTIFCLYNYDTKTEKSKLFNLYMGNYQKSIEPDFNAKFKDNRDNKYKLILNESISESKESFSRAETEIKNCNYVSAMDLLNKVIPLDKGNYIEAQKLIKTCITNCKKNQLQCSLENSSFNVKIPILMYHSIDYEKGNSLRVPKEKFYEQMKYLKDNGYTLINLDDIYDIQSGQMESPKKPIAVTFDDGYEDNYSNAYPILKELGLKATIFVITDEIDKSGGYINSSQIREMTGNGISVESHTADHSNLSGLSYKDQYETLKKSKEKLELIEGKKIKYIAYPFGKYNKFTEEAAKYAGYIMAVTTKSGFTSRSHGYFFLPRVRISSYQSLDSFIKTIS